MEIAIGPLIRIVEATGPIGAILAAIIVGLCLALIVFARSQGLFNDARTAQQQAEFQKRLLEQVERLMHREEVLIQEMSEVQAHVALMRVQLRKAIDLLRQVREGRVAPDAIDTDAIGGEP
ncbi:hypothetical protein [Methylobacterium aquaticum]|uniref:Uncharacterized protein n=1 Tax=Methylobacterium aquaticum TaxID=270351 RepID=A0A0J6SGM8_9HYPH|nr:hypothetical protein [Methylobacterium aquaticum]KMO32493.1 hypothetical protein VP06_17565 [Methylobacterium aquaticum]